MSSPIAIHRAASESPVSSPSTSPVRALYVPLHRRTPSDASSSSSGSRPSSPAHNGARNPVPKPHPHIYTPAALLALRPAGPTSLALAAQAHIRAACPAVLANSRARKHAAFMAKRARQAPAPVPAPVTAEAPTEADVEVLAPVGPPTQQQQQRVTPRRTRPAGRGPERRRAALQLGENWRAMRALAPQAPVSVL